MNKPERKDKTAYKKDALAVISVLACICGLIYRIPLTYIIGERGISYFSIANELYLLAGCILSYGLSEAVSNLVRYRIRREQFRNADKVLRGAFLLALVTGGILSILFVFAGHAFAENAAKMPLAGMAVSFMAPAIIFQMLTGAFKGYFQGNGSRVPAIHSKILETLFMIISGLTGAGLLHQYGEKVSALLQNEDYAASYGAMGASIGILAASVLCFLHMLLLFFLYHGNAKRQISKDIQKNQDKVFHIVHMLTAAAFPYFLYQILFQLPGLLDACLFIRFSQETTDSVTKWGNYYGKYAVIIGIAGALISLTGFEQTRRIAYWAEREEYRTAREKLGTLIHQLLLISVPASVFIAVFAENLLDLFFKGNNAVTASYVMWGSVIIVLNVLSGFFANMLVRMKCMKYVIGYAALSLIFHIVTVVLLLGSTALSVTAVIIGNIVFYGILLAAGFLLLCRILQYKQEWLKAVAFTVIAAGIAGIIAMLLNKLLISLAGSVIALVICLPVGIIIYMVLLIVIRGVTENELKNMSLGKIMIRLGKLLHFM